jgi:D-alanine-D-alanine ligase
MASGGRIAGEFDLSAAVSGVADVLPEAELAGVRGAPAEVFSVLERCRPDVVFNACEAPLGRPDLEPHVASLLEWMGVRFTGSGSETLGLCRRKDRTNVLLAAAGVPVPRSGIFPCVVKPADEDGSAWIDAASLCMDASEVAQARSRLPGPAVVQEFVPGREFAVSLWGEREPEHISIGETRFESGLQLITYAAKWDIDSADFANSPLFYNTDVEPKLCDAVSQAARESWRVVGARGYLRVDIRLDSQGQPCVLDVNPNPELSPGVGICRAAAEAGWSWTRFVRQQIEWACS